MTEDELRERLLDLLRRITTFDGGPSAQDALIDEFARLAPHPAATAFIFWADLLPDEVVRRAMDHRPIELPTREGYPARPPLDEPSAGFVPPELDTARGLPTFEHPPESDEDADM